MGEDAAHVIERASAAEVPSVAGMLARAFRDNPGFIGMLRGDEPEQRLRTLTGCMLGFCAAVQRFGTIELIRDAGVPVAATLAFAPGRYPMPAIGQLRVAAGVIGARPTRAHRFARADLELQRHHPREPHAYLWFLGTEPARQGQGFGSRLLREFIARAETARAPSYLETDRERNVRLYERHGFRVLGDAIVPGMNTRMWFMQR